MKARFAALAVVAAVAAGCSSGSSGGGDTTGASPPVTESPSVSSSPTESPSESATPTPSFSSTVKATQHCLTKHLSLSLGQGQGAAGSSIVPIVLTNTGSHGCTLYGFPGVSFLDANGAKLGVDASQNGGEKAIVTLAPNGTANALLQMPDPGNFGPGDCQPATSARLQVYPPGDFSPLTIEDVTTVCTTSHGWASVSPVTPGSGG